jgi:hypothetical protein
MTLQSTQYEIYGQKGGYIAYQNINFGTAGLGHTLANQGGRIETHGNNTISGGATWHFGGLAGGQNLGCSTLSTCILTLTGTPAFSSQFASAGVSGIVVATNITFVGSATGQRYLVDGNSTIYTGTGSPCIATFFPGNSAGAATNNGICQ